MTDNGTRPTAADVSAAFDEAGPVLYLVSPGHREEVLRPNVPCSAQRSSPRNTQPKPSPS